MKLYYNPKLKKLARRLRNNMSLPEILLWNQLKGKKLGYDFHRQKPIDNYIVDFFCPKLKLIIEVDGEVHKDKGEDDIERQSKLESVKISSNNRSIRQLAEEVYNFFNNVFYVRNTPRLPIPVKSQLNI